LWISEQYRRDMWAGEGGCARGELAFVAECSGEALEVYRLELPMARGDLILNVPVPRRYSSTAITIEIIGS
jgi:hypothetical protein